MRWAERIGSFRSLTFGIGKPEGVFAQAKTGLGTGIVKAIAQQLGAEVETLAGPDGTTMAITRATFETQAIRAA